MQTVARAGLTLKTRPVEAQRQTRGHEVAGPSASTAIDAGSSTGRQRNATASTGTRDREHNPIALPAGSRRTVVSHEERTTTHQMSRQTRHKKEVPLRRDGRRTHLPASEGGTRSGHRGGSARVRRRHPHGRGTPSLPCVCERQCAKRRRRSGHIQTPRLLLHVERISRIGSRTDDGVRGREGGGMIRKKNKKTGGGGGRVEHEKAVERRKACHTNSGGRRSKERKGGWQRTRVGVRSA